MNKLFSKKAAITMGILLCSCVVASAWGWPHRLIAYTAQEHCTPATRAELDRYLDAPLNNVASWLDQFRSAPWKDEDWSGAPNYTFKAWEHAVSVDENFRPLKHSNRVEGNGEGYGAFLRYVENLKNRKNLPDSAVIVDLKALIHIIGDVHCPGHILYSIDKETPDTMGGGIAGGYGIWTHTYKGKTKTLHALLDDADFIHPEFERSLEKFRQYMDTLSVEHQKQIIAGTMADYIQDAARRSTVVYDWVTPGCEVDDTFFTDPGHEKLLLYLIQASAYRTAHILNTIFDPDYTGPVDSGFDKVAAEATVDGASAPKGTFIEGIIISDCNSLNMGPNVQTSWNEVDATMCRRTAYFQEQYGKRGVKLLYRSPADNVTPQFSRVRISLDGCILRREQAGGGIVIEGVKDNAVEVLATSVALKPEHKRISDIGAGDLYTLVTIDNVEFLAKEGSFTNVRELNVQPTFINSFKKKDGSDWFDEAGTYVRDNCGNTMFLPVNTVCAWRRRGDRLPAGIGSVSGIVVNETLERCACPGPYQLRIASDKSVQIARDEASSYETVVRWDWDRNYYASLKCEGAEYKWIEGMIPAAEVLPDVGNGALRLNVPAEMGLEKEFNSRSVQDGLTPGEGSRENAAIAYHTRLTDWTGKKSGPYKDAGLYVEFSTMAYSGRGLSLDLCWVAGDGTDKYTAAVPKVWTVSWSVDGGPFVNSGKTVSLRTLAWKGGTPVPADAAVGYVYNSVLLPSSLLGHDKVVIRISPVLDKTAGRDSELYLRIGSIAASALK